VMPKIWITLKGVRYVSFKSVLLSAVFGAAVLMAIVSGVPMLSGHRSSISTYSDYALRVSPAITIVEIEGPAGGRLDADAIGNFLHSVESDGEMAGSVFLPKTPNAVGHLYIHDGQLEWDCQLQLLPDAVVDAKRVTVTIGVVGPRGTTDRPDLYSAINFKLAWVDWNSKLRRVVQRHAESLKPNSLRVLLDEEVSPKLAAPSSSSSRPR
jgi:hypothetical protein